jgi:uncharacterized protein
MSYHEGELEVQRRAGVTEEAGEVGRIVRSTIPRTVQAFLLEQRFLVLSSADGRGYVWASLLSGEPGFVRAAGDSTVEVAATPRAGDPIAEALKHGGEAGMLAIEFATRRRARLNGVAKPWEGGRLRVELREVYGNCPQYIHPEHELRVEAGGAKLRSVRKELAAEQEEWIRRADTLFIATRHPQAGADASHRGGKPGFVRVASRRRLVIPDYAGNKMFNTLGNIAAQPRAGLLFVDFGSGATLQLSGRGKILWEGQEVESLAGAQRATEFEIDEVVEIRGE